MGIITDLITAARDYAEVKRDEKQSFTLLAPEDRASKARNASGFGAGLMFPSYSSGGAGYPGNFTDVNGNPLWQTLYRGTKIDYVREVGDLLQSSLLMAAIKWVGRTLPEAPLYVSKRAPAGHEEARMFDHPLTELLDTPNDYYSGQTLMKAFAASWILSGNVYFYKVKNPRGRVIQLWYLPHWMVTPAWPTDGSEFISSYIYRIDGKEHRVPKENIIHFRDGIDPRNQRMGLSAVGSLYREIYSDNEAANFAAVLLRNFGVGSFIVTPNEAGLEIGDAEAEELKEKLRRNTTGDERGKPIIAGSNIRVEKLSFKPDELDLAQIRHLPEERVAAGIGINGIVLGFGAAWQNTIFNTVSEAREEAFENYLLPLQSYIGRELGMNLLPDFEAQPRGFKVAWDYTNVRVLQDDRDKLFKRVSVAYQGGWIDRAEARQATGYEARPEDVDVFYSKPAAFGDQSQMGQGGGMSTDIGQAISDVLDGEPISPKARRGLNTIFEEAGTGLALPRVKSNGDNHGEGF